MPGSYPVAGLRSIVQRLDALAVATCRSAAESAARAATLYRLAGLRLAGPKEK